MAKDREIQTGKRGGRFYVTATGQKVYLGSSSPAEARHEQILANMMSGKADLANVSAEAHAEEDHPRAAEAHDKAKAEYVASRKAGLGHSVAKVNAEDAAHRVIADDAASKRIAQAASLEGKHMIELNPEHIHQYAAGERLREQEKKTDAARERLDKASGAVKSDVKRYEDELNTHVNAAVLAADKAVTARERGGQDAEAEAQARRSATSALAKATHLYKVYGHYSPDRMKQIEMWHNSVQYSSRHGGREMLQLIAAPKGLGDPSGRSR